MTDFQQKNEHLNALLESGQAMNGFELFYHEQVSMQENETEPRLGKTCNREACQGFIDAYPDLKLTILSVGYGENKSYQEVLFEYTHENGEKIYYPELSVRTWEDGWVVKEKFYYSS